MATPDGGCIDFMDVVGARHHGDGPVNSWPPQTNPTEQLRTAFLAPRTIAIVRMNVRCVRIHDVENKYITHA